jgi:acetyl/propionyl-CoA carboxylase alpha subunit
MKIVRERDQLAQMYRTASAESLAAFGNGDMYMERYVERPRHIEIQIVADEHGNVVHLGERECSVQRRHQKMLEESPSPALNERLRERMGRVAVEAMRKVRYNNVGTIEFLIDSGAYEQYRVLPFYDSMVAKLIVYADSRPAAIMRMRRALEEYIVEGIRTNIAFHKKLLVYEPFVQGRYDTRLVEKLLADNPN